MVRIVLAPCALALALVCTPAQAASDADLAEIREQIRQLKESYEARIQALEQKLQAAEVEGRRRTSARRAGVRIAARGAVPGADARPHPHPSQGIAAFNPAISAVLQGVYANLSQDPNQYAIAGFAPSGDIVPASAASASANPSSRSSANVDDKFYGNLIVLAHAGEHGLGRGGLRTRTPRAARSRAEVRALPSRASAISTTSTSTSGTSRRAARLPGVPRRPVPRTTALQVKWIAPTDQFVELGAEVGNGEGFPGTDRNKNGIGDGNAYVHTGGDVGASNSWRAGLSYLQTAAQGSRLHADGSRGQRRASSRFQGSSADRHRRLRLEVGAQRQRAGHQLQAAGRVLLASRERRPDLRRATARSGLDAIAAAIVATERLVRAGRLPVHADWRVGARYDRLDPGSVDYGANGAVSRRTARSTRSARR